MRTPIIRSRGLMPWLHRAYGLRVGLALASALAICATAEGQTAPKNASPWAYYTAEQAGRGKVMFEQHCAACHADLYKEFSQRERSGFMSLDQFVRRAPSVYYLFQHIRDSEPQVGADSVALDIKVDIVAYLLQRYGFPAGSEPLTSEVRRLKAMRVDDMVLPPSAGSETLPGSPGRITSEARGRLKAMRMDDKDFRPLFNGRDFTNFKFLLGPRCRPAPAGCGRTVPDPVFSVRDGMIVNTGKVLGFMYTTERFLNFTLRLEYRYQPPPDWEGETQLYSGNSGYFLFVNDLIVHQQDGIEIQGRAFDVLNPIMRTKAKVVVDDDARRRADHALGQWNSVEIVSSGGQVTSYLNGTLVSTITDHEFKEPGHIGFQSAGGVIEWRNIRIKAN